MGATEGLEGMDRLLGTIDQMQVKAQLSDAGGGGATAIIKAAAR